MPFGILIIDPNLFIVRSILYVLLYVNIPEIQDKIDELMNRMMGCDMTYASAHVELEKVSFVIGYTLHGGLKPYPIW